MIGKSFFKYLAGPALWMLVIIPLAEVPVPAADFKVNTIEDTVDINPGDGEAKDQNGNCSLRAAIMEANGLVGPDTILLGPTVYQLTITGAREDEGLKGDLDIFSNLTIQGAGIHETIIDANGLDRAFHIRGFWNVSLVDLTIRNGWAPDGFWDDSIGGFRSGASGGGILCRNGNLSIVRCCICQNRTGNGELTSSGPGYAGYGGGIYCKGGRLDMIDSSVSENFTGFGIGRYAEGRTGNGGGVCLVDCVAALENCSLNQNRLGETEANRIYSGNGGGLYLLRGEATLRNCTVSYNSGGVVSGYGGGIYVEETDLSLAHCTVARNKSWGDYGSGGGIYPKPWDLRVTLKSTIVTDNYAGLWSEGHDMYGRFISLGYNLIGDSLGWYFLHSAPGDLVGEPARLGPLRDNGGPTKTMALLPQSAAIDAADPQGTVVTDQRGMARPQDGDYDLVAAPDIGAFEVAFPMVSIVSPDNGSTVRGIVTIEAEAENAKRVEFYVDGDLAEEVEEPPFLFDWDTASYANGTHSLTAVAVDMASQNATDGIVVFLDNILVRLEVERRIESGWLLKREFADLRITVPNLSPTVVSRVKVLRKRGAGEYQILKEVEAVEFEDDCCRLHDLLHKTGETTTYRAVAVDGVGNVLGQSLEKNL